MARILLIRHAKAESTEEDSSLSELGKRQAKAIVYVSKYGRITNDEYQKLTKCSDRTATNDLKEMVRKKVLRAEGRGRGTYYAAA